jgi:hypothetical protein
MPLEVRYFVALYMDIAKKLILFVVISHALILVGFGHSLAVVGLTVFFAPAFIASPDFLDLLLLRADALPAMGTLSLLGYLGLIIAFFSQGRRRSVFYFISVIILWWSIAYLVVPKDSWEIVYPLPPFYFPFLIVSLSPLYWERLKSLISG